MTFVSGFYKFFVLTLFLCLNSLPNTVSAAPAAPVFDHDHGFFDQPFSLALTCNEPGAVLYYTLDGSKPTVAKGIRYKSPISIQTTTVVRAVAVSPTSETSTVTTRTFLFPDAVLKQTNTPAGYPSKWGTFKPYTTSSDTLKADYEMDPEITNDATLARQVREGLLSIPTLSLVTDIGNFFNPVEDTVTGGIYMFTGGPLTNTTYGPGRGWERPVSVEYFTSEGGQSFQVDAGIRIQGGHSRRPEKSPKHSFLLVFKGEYGPEKLNFPLFPKGFNTEHNKLILRAEFCNSWIHATSSERKLATYQRDIWGKDAQRAMGHLASQSIHAHLYINGIYWGLYAPSERMDADYAEAYLKGNEDDFDVIKDYQEVQDGSIDAWNQMMTMVNDGLSSDEAYFKLQGLNPNGTRNPAYPPMVDVVNLADYMLLNFYGSNTDWDHHNWAAIRNRVRPGKGFKFFAWDNEHLIKTVDGNVLNENNNGCPSRIFQNLMQNNRFKRLFADRVRLHCYDNGVLTPERSVALWNQRTGTISKAVHAESARWGDYRRDVHKFSSSPYELYTVSGFWTPQQDFMTNTYFPQRTAKFISQLKAASFYPSVEAPDLLLDGKAYGLSDTLRRNGVLTMRSASGVIYYTLDGSDPAESPTAAFYSKSLTLAHSTHVKARVQENGNWSALTEQFFLQPTDYKALKITEVNYHPHPTGAVDGDAFEYIELKNTGSGTLDLGSLCFSKGIDYVFAPQTELKPGAFLVLADDDEAFQSRYGFYPYDSYRGKLANDGDTILLTDATEKSLVSFIYADGGSWASEADGFGKSLVPVQLNPTDDQTLPQYWRTSCMDGGSPGSDDLPGVNHLKDGSTAAVEPMPGLTVEGLDQNYPNPFGEETYLHFTLAAESRVRLDIFDLTGRPVTMLLDEDLPSGTHLERWNGCKTDGSALAPGTYVCRLLIRPVSAAGGFTGLAVRSFSIRMIKVR